MWRRTQMSRYDEIVERLKDINPEAVLLTGLEEALMGVAFSFGKLDVALYDYQKCVEIFSRTMTTEEAIEYLNFNVLGAHFSEHNPVFFMN
jgi:hypothetical protein